MSFFFDHYLYLGRDWQLLHKILVFFRQADIYLTYNDERAKRFPCSRREWTAGNLNTGIVVNSVEIK